MVKPIIAVLLLWIAVAAFSQVYGQQKENTLGHLWTRVEAYYPGIGAKEKAVQAADFEERAVRSNGLPQVKAQAQSTYGTYKGSAGAFFPQAGFFNVSGSAMEMNGSSFSSNSFGSATVEWEIFSFGKLRKENEAAHAASNKKISEQGAYVLNLKKILAERYIDLLYSETKVQWNTKNVERLNEIRVITTGLSKAGLKPAADSLLALSSYTQSLGENDRLKGNKSASLIKLSELYGGRSIDYKTSVRRFSVPDIFAGERNKKLDDAHPILNALKNQEEFYTLKSEVQKRSSLPSLRLLGGYAYRGTGISSNGTVSGKWMDGFSNTTHNFLAGIGITWNMTSLTTSRFRSQGLWKEAESIRQTYQQYEQAMQADLLAAQAKIGQQYKQIRKTTDAVKQAEDAYNMYLSRYKSGLIDLNNLLQIRLLIEVAENNHIEASREYWMLVAYEAELTSDFDFLFNHL